MTTAPSERRPSRAKGAYASGRSAPTPPQLYAALDLGTNNCRLMIASYSHSSFRIVEAFSRIVRLGEGMGQTGYLGERAIERAIKALKICAEKIEKRGVVQIRAVATQACRVARNGRDFIRRVEKETGLRLTIISPEEEAHLAVVGCASLLDSQSLSPAARAAIVLDVGGGSTELSWVSLPPNSRPATSINALRTGHPIPRPAQWKSIPAGVVTLAERFPENNDAERRPWFEAMVADVSAHLSDCAVPAEITEAFADGEAYIVGTSGAITSLAGMHLKLERYDRNRVDGLWMDASEIEAVIERLLSQSRSERELEPCIGQDRADLVLAGAAILVAVQRLWPCQKLRVADRGLREGLLLSMVKKKNRRRRSRRGARVREKVEG